MRNKPTYTELLEVQNFFKLPSPALVEKDWYVVQALAVIYSMDIAPFLFVFSGGTALSRARNLTRRMSEDIDLRIVGKDGTRPSRSDLRRIKKQTTEALKSAGFLVGDPQSFNLHRKTVYLLPYDQTAVSPLLRPEIKIEMFECPVRLPTDAFEIRSFHAEAYERPPEILNVPCIALPEAIAEKFVALGRRSADCKLTNKPDATLVRHVYDIAVAQEHCTESEVLSLINVIMHDDAKEHRTKGAEYVENPKQVLSATLQQISEEKTFRSDYANFLAEMVYGHKPEFAKAFGAVSRLVEALKTST